MTTPMNIDATSTTIATPPGMVARISSRFGSTSRKGVWAIGDQAVVSGTNFLSTVIVGRWCGLDELGLYSLAFSILLLVCVFQQSLILNPYAVFSNRLSARRKKTYSGSVLVQQGFFMAAGVLVLMSLTFATWYVFNLASMGQVFCALVLAMPLFSLRDFTRHYLLAQLDARATLFFDASVAVIQISGFLFLGISHLLSASSAYMVVAVACGLPSILWLGTNKKAFTIRRRLIKSTLGRHWNFGRWICASQFTIVVQTYSLHWILAISLGLSAAGVYTAYSSLVLIFNPFILAVGGLLLPRAAQVHHEGGVRELRRIIGKATEILGIVILALCVPVVIFGDRMVHHLFELDGNVEMGGLIVALLATALVGAASFASENGLCVLERPKINFVAGVCGLVVTWCASPLLALWYGIEGAAWGVFIAVFIASAVPILGFLRMSNIELRRGVTA